MALTIPNSFVAATPIEADPMNDNFDAIETYVNSSLVETADHDTDLLGKLSGKPTDPVQLTANSATFTALADIAGFSITFTAVANRMYKIEVFANVSSSVAGDWAALRLRTSGGSQIQSCQCELPVINEEQTLNMVAFVTPGAGSVTYKVSGERLSGTGNIMVEASATMPAIISVQDFGAD